MSDTAKLLSLAVHAQALAGAGRRRAPEAKSGTWRIANEDTDRAEVFIYGAISDWYGDVNAADFVQALASITAPAISVRVNSPGGLVFDAVAIYTALKDHPANVDVRIDGIAASAASFIAQAGDTISIAKPARMMIHDAQGFTVGGPAEHREMLDLLNDLSDMIAEIYADRAGGTVADWRAPMQATTWYTAAAAVESGLADEVIGAPAEDDDEDQDEEPAEDDDDEEDIPAGDDEDDDEDQDEPAARASQLLRARARVTLGIDA